MTEARFETLFREELEMLYDAEQQVVDALPKIIAATSSQPVATALQEHRDETEKQVAELERIFERMGEQPAVRLCEAMQALVQEGEALIAKMEKSPVLDIGLIGTVQKIQSYEICGYGTVRVLAEALGQQDTVDVIDEALDEKTTASETVDDLSEDILAGDVEAAGQEDLDEEDLDGEMEGEDLDEEELVDDGIAGERAEDEKKKKGSAN